MSASGDDTDDELTIELCGHVLWPQVQLSIYVDLRHLSEEADCVYTYMFFKSPLEYISFLRGLIDGPTIYCSLLVPFFFHFQRVEARRKEMCQGKRRALQVCCICWDHFCVVH